MGTEVSILVTDSTFYQKTAVLFISFSLFLYSFGNYFSGKFDLVSGLEDKEELLSIDESYNLNIQYECMCNHSQLLSLKKKKTLDIADWKSGKIYISSIHPCIGLRVCMTQHIWNAPPTPFIL